MASGKPEVETMILMRLKTCNVLSITKNIKVYIVYGVDNLRTDFNKTGLNR